MFNIELTVRCLIDKQALGVPFSKGCMMQVLINDKGYAAFKQNQRIRFSPHEYELVIDDKEYDNLLA